MHRHPKYSPRPSVERQVAASMAIPDTSDKPSRVSKHSIIRCVDGSGSDLIDIMDRATSHDVSPSVCIPKVDIVNRWTYKDEVDTTDIKPKTAARCEVRYKHGVPHQAVITETMIIDLDSHRQQLRQVQMLHRQDPSLPLSTVIDICRHRALHDQGKSADDDECIQQYMEFKLSKARYLREIEETERELAHKQP